MFLAKTSGVAPLPDDWFYVVRDGEILIRNDSAELPTLNELGELAADRPPHLLGESTDGRHHWAVETTTAGSTPKGFGFVGVRSLWGGLDELHWNVAGRATQVIEWQRSNRYCGCCATAMELIDGERAMHCPADGHTVYPRLSPAVIVAVERDGHILLGRSGHWSIPMYSVLAGFVEPGETLEETVIREIKEEVGVTVTNPRYVASQPWPFPNSLMLGFTAQWEAGEIEVDGVEILDAHWYPPGAFPEVTPGPPSIAHQLICEFVDRTTTGS